MLSRVWNQDTKDGRRQESAWSGRARVPRLTVVSDSVTPDDDREEYLARLGLVLRLGRKAAGLRQEEAAARLGVNSRAFTRWEAGDNVCGGGGL
jgi:ribosome-binding protein aMBF1 (putative translation factor)